MSSFLRISLILEQSFLASTVLDLVPHLLLLLSPNLLQYSHIPTYSFPRCFLSQSSSCPRTPPATPDSPVSLFYLKCLCLRVNFPAQLLSSSFHSATVHHNPSSSSSETQDFYSIDCQKPQSPGSDYFCIVVLFL